MQRSDPHKDTARERGPWVTGENLSAQWHILSGPAVRKDLNTQSDTCTDAFVIKRCFSRYRKHGTWWWGRGGCRETADKMRNSKMTLNVGKEEEPDSQKLSKTYLWAQGGGCVLPRASQQRRITAHCDLNQRCHRPVDAYMWVRYSKATSKLKPAPPLAPNTSVIGLLLFFFLSFTIFFSRIQVHLCCWLIYPSTAAKIWTWSNSESWLMIIFPIK